MTISNSRREFLAFPYGEGGPLRVVVGAREHRKETFSPKLVALSPACSLRLACKAELTSRREPMFHPLVLQQIACLCNWPCDSLDMGFVSNLSEVVFTSLFSCRGRGSVIAISLPRMSSLSIPTLRVGRAECSRSGCSSSFSLQDVILSTRGLYPLWLRIVVISAHVEVLRKERSGWSKTADRRDLIRV